MMRKRVPERNEYKSLLGLDGSASRNSSVCKTIFTLSIVTAVLLTIASVVIQPIHMMIDGHSIDWARNAPNVQDFIPKTLGHLETAKSRLHDGSGWGYLNQEEWDDFVLHGIGAPGQKLYTDAQAQGRKLKLFEIGSGTGAALSTIVRTYPTIVEEVYGLEAFHKSAEVCDVFFAQEHPGLLVGPGPERKKSILEGLATKETMSSLPDQYYDHVLSNGVLCYLPSIDTLREVLVEVLRILKPGGILSASTLADDENGELGYHYASISLTISEEHFWRALQDELGYKVINVELMGSWKGHSHQKSRYAIQIRKNQDGPVSKAVTDLTAAKAVSAPTLFHEVQVYVFTCAGLAVFFFLIATTIYWVYIKKV